MIEFLTYDLKVAALLAVFYMFYRLMLSRETFHCLNRVVLLMTAIASFLLPLCVITIHQTIVVEGSKADISLGQLKMMVADGDQLSLWHTILIVVFCIGMVATLSHTLYGLFRVWLLIRRSEQHPQSDGTVICVAKGDVSPFSWMHYIVLSQSDYEAHDASILAHERGHVRHRHSIDLILVDSLTALQWFNPAMWMLRQDLRAIHEYEADAAVLSQGINMRQYQYLLIQKAVAHCGYSVVNGISHSTLKNRINMMLNKKSNRASMLKLLAFLPIVGVALALNAETVNDYVYTDEKPVVPVVNVDSVEPDEPLDVVEQMPEFPGGTVELMKFIASNVKYPVKAQKEGVQGRVLVQFIIEKDGTVSGPKVVRAVNIYLDAEAVRVVKLLPKWKPGMQKGQPVRVKFTLPVTFKLQ